MITHKQREDLASLPLPAGIIGYDCDGKHIYEGDKVEVVREDEMRRNKPEYSFCYVGKRGTATLHESFPYIWCVLVNFEEYSPTGSVGCIDYSLRKIS